MATENGDTQGLSVRDLILEVRSDVKELNTTVTSLSERAAVGHSVQADQESRIRALERWSWTLPPTVIVAVLSLAATLLMHGS